MTGGSRLALRVLLGLGILVLVLLTVDPVAALGLLARADPLLLLVGVTGLTAVHLVPATAWWAMLPMLAGIRVPWSRAASTFYAAQAIGGVTPANIGGDVHRAVAVRGAGLSWAASVAPLIVQRATSYAALGLLSLLAVAVLVSSSALAVPLVAVGVGTVVLVAIGSWLVLAPPSRLAGAGRWLLARLGAPETRGAPATPAAEPRRAARLGRATALGLASGLAFHTLSIGLTLLLILALDPVIPLPVALAAITVARLSLAVPITPSGLGVQEGVLALLFGSVGLAPETAIAGLLLGRLALVLTTGIGVLLLAGSGRVPLAPERPVRHGPVVR